MNDKLLLAIGAAGGLWLVRNLYIMLLGIPEDADQGAIYRIIYFHVPSWFTCFSCFFGAAVASGVAIWKKRLGGDSLAVAMTEVGCAYTAIGLVTGMIWARIIWGIWWTWDPRLTWAFITFLIYSGYLMMRRMIDEPGERMRVTGALSLFAFTSVVITYKAIDWWRTQHPGPVLSFRTGGGRMDPAMESMLFQNWGALVLVTFVMIVIRYRQEEAMRELEGLRRLAYLR